MAYKLHNNSTTKKFYTMPAEWEVQERVQLTWPHETTDWASMLDEVVACFTEIAREVALREQLTIVTPFPLRVEEHLRKFDINMEQVTFFKCSTNDTWARDHGFITLIEKDDSAVDSLQTEREYDKDSSTDEEEQTLSLSAPLRYLDFCFNGWGMKFAANLDNQINRKMYESGNVGEKSNKGEYLNMLDFVLEGGSIESDGQGTLMTTTACLTAPNRNALHTTKEALEKELCKRLGMERVLWIDHGYLAGDDTDSHVDTLARFCPDDTIAYVQCLDETDEHYPALHRMEEQLKGFRTLEGKPYRLLPLPMAEAVYDNDGARLPATYANFLIINGAVLYPTYNSPQKDKEAMEQLQRAFPGREIIGIDCSPLIRQHGSLHCVTMQFPYRHAD